MSGDHEAIERLKRDDERIEAAVRELLLAHGEATAAETYSAILRDLLAEVETELREEYRIDIEGIGQEAMTVPCPECGVGGGAIGYHEETGEYEECPTCHGTGRIPLKLAGALEVIEASRIVGDGMSDDFRAGSDQRGHCAKIIAREKYGPKETT